MPISHTFAGISLKRFGFLGRVAGAVATDPYFDYTTLLLPGSGTNGSNNNAFLDSSGNGLDPTRNGNTTQGTFSPFSQTGWSNYFDGTANGSLRADSSTDTNLSGDFTVQAWVFPTANGQSSNSEIICRGAASTLNGWHLGLPSGGSTVFFQVNYSGLGNSSTSIQTSTSIPLNQWTHIAVTRSGNTAKIYLNGQLDTTNTGFTTAPTVSGTEYVYVGRASYDTSNRQFTGYVSNASIIKGTALTTFNTTTPLATGTSGQSLLTCTANRFIDANTATTEKTLTVGTGASVQAFSPFAPTAAYSAATNGGSGYFDGTGDYLTFPDNAVFDYSTGDFTCDMWVYPTSVSGDRVLLQLGNYGSGASGIVFLLSNGGKVFIGYNNSFIGEATGSVIANAWNHVSFIRSSGTIKMYVNGAEKVSSSFASSIAPATNFGVGIDVGAGSSAFVGYMSAVRLSNNARSSSVPTSPPTNDANTNLLLNFTNAGITDATAKNDLETVGNAQISNAQAKWGSTSISLSASGNTLKTPLNQDLNVGSGDFTVEGWVYFTTVTGVGSANGIFQMSNTAGGFAPNQTNNLALGTSDGNKWQIYAKNTFTSSSTTTISSGTWYHFALCRYGSTTVLYINGTATITLTSDTATYNTPYLGLGSIYDSTSYPTLGYIQDFRVTKGIARYTANFTAPTAAFPLL